MEKKRFIPFDAETFLMIEDVTGTEPEVTEKENYFELKMYAPDKEERIIEAAIYAVQGRYGKRIKDVRTIFEEKDANTAGLTFDEKILFEKMNKLFGKNIEKRLGKLAEEYNELFEAFERYLSREKTQREINEINPGTHDIIDELADVNVVLFHIAALLGYSQKELQEMAYTKIAGREKNPEFMRKHPHNKPESPVCGNMQQETAEQYKHFENRFNKRL